MTFRIRGHEEASGTKYVPKELMQHWALKDPVKNYERFLLDEGLLNEPLIEEIRGGFTKEIQEAIDVAFSEEPPILDMEEELRDVYAPLDYHVIARPEAEAIPNTIAPNHGIASVASLPRNDKTQELRFVDAISDGLREAMRTHPKLLLMGQDIAEYGGVFKVTEGFVQEFGRERVRNTPLCESAIIGAGLGLSVKGWKSVIEMQFADFVTSGFNQVVNNLAKIYWRWGQNADVVIRMPAGAGVGAGPFHSQSNEAWFTHTPGLKVVYPSNPHDAKGLLIASIEDPNPVMFFEHKALNRSLKAEVPLGYYAEEIGKARLVREGDDVSIITYGMGVVWARDLLNRWETSPPPVGRGRRVADLLDLRTLQPLDYDAIAATVKRTGKVIVLHEDTLFGGIGGEIAAWISEHCFESLDAPVVRVASLDTPVPFAETMERSFLASARLEQKLLDLLKY
jgi:2-oxoisovalerate dehydrogenase E1 component